MICRRNLFLIALSFQISLVGVLLLIVLFSKIENNPQGPLIAFILLLCSSVFNLLLCALIVFVFRNRGTIYLDELKDIQT